jgi:hypothetical protein
MFTYRKRLCHDYYPSIINGTKIISIHKHYMYAHKPKLCPNFCLSDTIVRTRTPARLHNSKYMYYQGGVISPTLNPQRGAPGTTLCFGPYPMTCLPWVALPGAYAPASIALLVNGARRLSLQDMVVIMYVTSPKCSEMKINYTTLFLKVVGRI